MGEVNSFHAFWQSFKKIHGFKFSDKGVSAEFIEDNLEFKYDNGRYVDCFVSIQQFPSNCGIALVKNYSFASVSDDVGMRSLEDVLSEMGVLAIYSISNRQNYLRDLLIENGWKHLEETSAKNPNSGNIVSLLYKSYNKK